MLTNLLHRIARQAPREYARGFIRNVRIGRGPARHRRIERLLRICWVLIAVKCAVVAWAADHYRMPFSPLWVIVPTVAFAALVTAVYGWRD